jgi:hypothetical protein
MWQSLALIAREEVSTPAVVLLFLILRHGVWMYLEGS